MAEPLRLLAVFAHPDDESFGPGGTLALYAQQGVEVHLICATRGEVGGVSEEIKYLSSDLASLREMELQCAAAHLGLAQVHFLGYRDSGMPGTPENEHPQALVQAPIEEVVQKVTQIIRQVQPQVLITFDPIGGYRHPDHIAMHDASVQAFHAAGDPEYAHSSLPPYQPQKMYFSTFPRTRLRWLTRLLPLFGRNPRQWGRNKDIDLVDIAAQKFPIHARLDIRPVLDRKQRAAACHVSQHGGGPPSGGLIGWIFRLGQEQETFMRAYPAAPASLREQDLFAGIETNNQR